MDAQPMMVCPRCKAEEPDHDGFGMLAHVKPAFPNGCGWCSHPSRDNGVCGICGDVEQPVKHSAWVVMYVDVSTMPATVLGAGIFSEPRPTTEGKRRVVPLFKSTGDCYASAAEAAWHVLRSEPFAWLGELHPARRSRVSRP